MRGENALLCFQCQRCSSGCPNAGAMAIPPARMMRMAQVGLKLGRENIINLLYDFHFGQKSLGLNEERTGEINNTLREVDILRPSWAKAREANAAFGQGITATPLQIASAMNVFANDGYYVKPKITAEQHPEEEEAFIPQSQEEEKISLTDKIKTMLSKMFEVEDQPIK